MATERKIEKGMIKTQLGKYNTVRKNHYQIWKSSLIAEY
jgi:hypothetical protein